MISQVTLNHPKAIFFDLDGTLIDSAPDLAAAANHLRAARGLPPLALDCYRPMAGAGARGMLKVAFNINPEHSEFPELREDFFNTYQTSIGAQNAQTQFFPAIPELLEKIRLMGIKWGIVTNKASRFTEPLIAHLSALGAAEVVISGDTTAHTKPHPEPLLAACRQLHLAPEGCWYVGDDKRDIDAGRAATMLTVAANWGYEGEHPSSSWNADATLNHPLELLTLLDHSR